MNTNEKYDLQSFKEIKIPSSVKNIPRCDWCEKPLPKRHVTHQNNCQDHPVHHFCSKSCKEKWCHTESKRN